MATLNFKMALSTVMMFSPLLLFKLRWQWRLAPPIKILSYIPILRQRPMGTTWRKLRLDRTRRCSSTSGRSTTTRSSSSGTRGRNRENGWNWQEQYVDPEMWPFLKPDLANIEFQSICHPSDGSKDESHRHWALWRRNWEYAWARQVRSQSLNAYCLNVIQGDYAEFDL